jgi:AraC family transcriptional regulator
VSDPVPNGHFAGTLRADRAVGGIFLAETEYQARMRVPAHAHEHALCTIVLSGAMIEQRGARQVRCETGALIYHPSDEPHAHEFCAGMSRCFVVQFGAPWSDRMRALEVRQPSAPLDLRRGRANWLAGELYREFRSPDTAATLAIEGFALAMLSEIARSSERRERGARPGWLLRVVDMLHESGAATPQLAVLAEAAGVHPTHLARTFRRYYGCTLGQYVRRLRIEAARGELLAGKKPLSRIALEAGFADQAHFTRAFKALTGQTPGAYRREAAR